jgi:hypothetical protein
MIFGKSITPNENNLVPSWHPIEFFKRLREQPQSTAADTKPQFRSGGIITKYTAVQDKKEKIKNIVK